MSEKPSLFAELKRRNVYRGLVKVWQRGSLGVAMQSGGRLPEDPAPVRA